MMATDLDGRHRSSSSFVVNTEGLVLFLFRKKKAGTPRKTATQDKKPFGHPT